MEGYIVISVLLCCSFVPIAATYGISGVTISDSHSSLLAYPSRRDAVYDVTAIVINQMIFPTHDSVWARRLQTAAILNGVQPPQHSSASSQTGQQPGPPTQQPQQQPMGQQVSHQLPPLAPVSSSPSALHTRQQALRLQRLQVEHERLRLRQQEINKSEQSLRLSLREEAGPQQSQQPQPGQQTAQTVGQQSTQQTTQQQQGSEPVLTSAGLTLPSAPQTVTTAVTSASDPFITTTDFHSRQESADSGLGLGTNYSLPHTPEDFLASMEDVEITPSDAEMKTSPANNIIEAPELESMDSEDLVPTIQLHDDLSADFLNDMLETSKMENLHTWLLLKWCMDIPKCLCLQLFSDRSSQPLPPFPWVMKLGQRSRSRPLEGHCGSSRAMGELVALDVKDVGLD
ncbi:hypothetical protein Pcinc_017869 [Petrolisthes cinctipes]|uniref:Uncharacterized protein n=1 Tax=Petrolisthes cinctipes TaxID=88211 RepID=A0AAE1FTD8_PETCI|nr:hypothetical protein Pcinc_017869 [Petrolisthes cinctipes]